MVQNLDAADLMRLKDTALQFCEESNACSQQIC
jgi:hypothetical protein